MTYFSNSDDGLSFEAEHCAKCIHGKGDDDACPIMTAHVCFQGDEAAQTVLDLLILRNHQKLDRPCMMFIEKPGQTPWDK